MRLSTFRSLTAHLPGDLKMLFAGAKVCVLWQDKSQVSIGDGLLNLDDTHVIMHSNYLNSDCETLEMSQHLEIGAAHGAATVDQLFHAAQRDGEHRNYVAETEVTVVANPPRLAVAGVPENPSGSLAEAMPKAAAQVAKGEVESTSCDHLWEQQGEQSCTTSWIERCPKCEALRQRRVRRSLDSSQDT